MIASEPKSAVYAIPNSSIRFNVRVEDCTVWLTQKEIGEVFGISIKTVSEHLQNAFKGGEISENTVVRKNRITARDGKNYEVKSYSLEAILAVGYRSNPGLANRFRVWAERAVKEQCVQGLGRGVAGPAQLAAGWQGSGESESEDDDMAYSQEDTAVEEYVEL